MMETVRFYFAFNSPFAFLASTRIDEAVEPLGVHVDGFPVYSPRSAPPDFDNPRMRVLLADFRRHAAHYGLDLKPGPFADTKKACLGYLHAKAEGKERAFRERIYAARFLEGKDISDERTIAAAADLAGLDAEAVRRSIADETRLPDLQAAKRQAEADDAFGYPFFVYGDEKFWGNDRIEWLVRAIRGRCSESSVFANSAR